MSKTQRVSNKPTAAKEKSSEFLYALVVFVVLSFIYSMAYSGVFTTDDEHILAARSLSFAFDDEFNIYRVLGNHRVYTFSLSSGRWADEAANIEPVQAMLGALLARIAEVVGAGRVQTIFLLNIWVTAFTAVIIYLTTVQSGYENRTGLILAGLFGVCTIVFPYVKTYFRDPLAMMFLAGSWMFSQQIISCSGEEVITRKKVFAWVGLLFSLTAGVLSKNTVLIVVPILVIEILISYIGKRSVRLDEHFWITALLVFCGIAVCFIFWLRVVPRYSVLARFHPNYYQSLIGLFLTRPRPNLAQALLGPLVSPGKSIFIFSPILLVSLWALFSQFRRSISAWLYLLLLIFFQGLFYDGEWAGHVNWGLRYILPAIPLLTYSMAPVVEKLLKFHSGRIFLWLLSLISGMGQLLGVLVPVKQYYIEMSTATIPVSEVDLIWEARYSIFAWGTRWLFNGNPLDLAISRNSRVEWLLFGFLTFSIILIWLLLTHRWRLIAVGGFISIIVLNGLMMKVYQNDTEYEHGRYDLRESYRSVETESSSDDLILIKCYGTSIWKYWMNWAGANLEWVSLPYTYPSLDNLKKYEQSNNPEDALDGHTMSILNRAVSSGKTVWVLMPSDAPGAQYGLELDWLKEQDGHYACRDFDGGESQTELCRFDFRE